MGYYKAWLRVEDDQQQQPMELVPGRTVLGRKWPIFSTDMRISRSHCELNFSASVGIVTILALGVNPVYIRVGERNKKRAGVAGVIALQAADDPFFIRESDTESCTISLTPESTCFSVVIRAVERRGRKRNRNGSPSASVSAAANQDDDDDDNNNDDDIQEDDAQEATLVAALPASLFSSPPLIDDVEMKDDMAAGSTVSALNTHNHNQQQHRRVLSNVSPSPMELVDPSQPSDDLMEMTQLKPVAALTRQESFTREISVDQLKIIGKIGSGSCGVVWLAQWLGARVAVKKVVMSLLHGDALKEFQAETSMLKKLRHPNIVLFIGTVGRSSVAVSPLDSSGDLCLVTEYLARGSLQDVLSSSSTDLFEQAGETRAVLPCSMALKMALDAATGIAYLHDMKILHRDLKSANCLVAADGTVKIADLGLARFVNQSDNHQTFCGTLTHCAPEILGGAGYSGFAADVYSFGVILWEIMCHAEPYRGRSKPEIIVAVTQQRRRPELPSKCGELLLKLRNLGYSNFQLAKPPPVEVLSSREYALLGLAQICDLCWQHDPSARPTMSAVVEALSYLSAECLRRDEIEKRAVFSVPEAPHRAEVVQNSPPPKDPPADSVKPPLSIPSERPALNKKLSTVILNNSVASTPEQIMDEVRQTGASSDQQRATWELTTSELSWQEKLHEDDSTVTWRGAYRCQDVAIKAFKQKLDGTEQEEFRREVEVLSQVRSPRIAYFYGASIHPRPLLVTEYLPLTLVDVLSATDIRIDWDTVFAISRGIAMSLLHLHSWVPPVLVRALAPQNILCDVSSNFLIKITNLNLARVASSDTQTKLKTPASVYQSPESFISGSFTPSSDMFSFGIVLWEVVNRCLTGAYSRAFSEFSEFKFDFQKVLAISKRNLRPTIASSTPKPLATLIARCWDVDPSARPSSFLSVVEQIDNLREVYQKQKKRQSK